MDDEKPIKKAARELYLLEKRLRQVFGDLYNERAKAHIDALRAELIRIGWTAPTTEEPKPAPVTKATAEGGSKDD